VTKISILYKKKLFKDNFYKKTYVKFKKKFSKILGRIKYDLDSKKNTYHVLSKNLKLDYQIKDLKKFNKYQKVVIIGMGGSILGSQAIYEFFQFKIKKKFIFFDNLDYFKIEKFKKKNKTEKILFIVISKSGNTIETIENFISFKIIKKNAKNIIIISENKNNKLSKIVKKNNLYFIEHKNYIGGRYSVLSEVGLVPAYLMGLNIKKLRNNLGKYLKLGETEHLAENSIFLGDLLKRNKYKNLIFLNYAPQLDNFLYWYQQLIAESLGKKGKGFLPIISTAPKDHHSLLQLYLDGPKDKFFYIFSVENKKYKNVNINKIKEAQKFAAIKTLSKYNIPYREFKITEPDEQSLGELFSYFILETAIIGKLVNINPFDQPAVEQVKTLTKKILNSKSSK
jgi:glucose-6-phosphate isomerase